MDVRKRELQVDDLPEGAPVALDRFLLAMQVLLKHHQGRDLGALSVVAMSKVNQILRARTDAYRMTSEYWRARYANDLVPLMQEKWWTSVEKVVGNNPDRLAQIGKQKLEGMEQFKIRQLKDWDQRDDGEHPFFLFIAYLIEYLVGTCERYQPNNPPRERVQLYFDRLTLHVMLANYVVGDCWQETSAVSVSLDNYPLSVKDWIRFPALRSLFPILSYSVMREGDGHILPEITRAVNFFYDALKLGWRFDAAQMKPRIPTNILACVSCGETSKNLQQCGGCLGEHVVYCNSDCQRADWPNHAMKCGSRNYGKE